MEFVDVLDPTAPPSGDRLEPAVRLATLRGCVLGIRTDATWRSFDVFARELSEIAQAQWGVREVVLFDPGTRSGSGEEEAAKLGPFLEQVDVAIVGLGT